MKLGIVFCGHCNSLLVDSGYETFSTLKCVECGNEAEFKIGKVTVETDEVNVQNLIDMAKKEACIPEN